MYKWRTTNPKIKRWLRMDLENGNSNYNEQLYTYIITAEGTNKIKEDFIDNSILKKEHISGDVYLHNSDEGFVPHSYYSRTPIVCKINGKRINTTIYDLFKMFEKHKICINNDAETIICEKFNIKTNSEIKYGRSSKYTTMSNLNDIIKYGDTADDIEILDHDGRFVKLIQIHRHKIDSPLIKIFTNNKRSIVVTKNHPMIVYDTIKMSEDIKPASECIGYNLICSNIDAGYKKIEYPVVNKIVMFEHDDKYVYDITTESGTFSVSGLKCHNCQGLSLIDLLSNGYDNTVRPPKHFNSAMSQMSSNLYKNSLFYSGALSYSHVDLLLAPYIHEDKLSYDDIKQTIQNFLFCLDAAGFRRGQSLFVNISIDINVPNLLGNIIPTYVHAKDPLSEYQSEMDIFNTALLDLLIEGKYDKTPFTFPLLTVNYTDDIKNRKCNDTVLNKLYELTSKFGSPYFRNMTGDLKESEQYVHSMCCHLRVNAIDQFKNFRRGLWDIGSTLFDYVGGMNVITINLNRIGIEARDDNEYFERLELLLNKSAAALMNNRDVCDYLLKSGRYNISAKNFDNMFNIIGIAGGNESMINFVGYAMQSKESQRFALKVIDFINDKIDEFGREYDCLFGLEVPPLEKASNRLALKDVSRYPNAFVQNKSKNPYITPGFNFYVGSYISDIEWRSVVDKKATSGTVYHIFDGEYRDPYNMQCYIENFARYGIPYFTYSPVLSICSSHGVTYGIKYKCECGLENYVTAKIVGYCRSLKNWSRAKIDELHERRSRFV